MAPTEKKMKSKNFNKTEGNWRKSKNTPQGVKKKKKWIPDHKVYEGSVKEGQGFAFKRKQKVKHEYNRLLRIQRKKKNPESSQLYKEEYPEHLRHLYVAEAEKLRNEAWANRVNRSKHRLKGKMVEAPGNDAEAAEEELPGGTEETDSVLDEPEPTVASVRESLPMSNRMKKKLEKKTSYQKAKEAFESVKEKRRKKKEEYEKNKKQREEAIQKYKQKKMETFQMLSKKTKKGQPNLNLQMEYLLQKIQKS